MLTRYRKPAIALLVVLIGLVLVVPRLVSSGDDEWTVTADFVDTTGVYVGNEVQYLGVPVGEITEITPDGPVMRIHMRVDGDIRIPREAVAEIMQSALLTDRYVELGPVYKGGPALPSGANIAAGRTRSPVSFDELGEAIDALVVALDREGPDGRDVGDLVAVTARNLDGNGARIRRLIVSSKEALASINRKEPDLRAVAKNLDILARALGARDAMVRRFTTNMSNASKVVAGQTESLDETLRSLSVLTSEVSGFVEQNRGVLKANLKDVSEVTATIRSQQDELARIFDYLPTGAENIARAYDPRAKSLRVEIAARETAFFNSVLRQEFCLALAGPLCSVLTNATGTGALDLLLDGVESQIPGGL